MCFKFIVMKREIIKDLFVEVKKYLDKKRILDYSVLGQDFGCIIFLYYYTRKYNLDCNLVDPYIDRMLVGELDYNNIGSYCNGLAGLGIGLTLMENDGLISGVDSILHNLDVRLLKSKEFDFVMQNMDFLHGFIGIGFYLIYRYNSDKEFAKTYLLKILDFLDKSALYSDDCIYWKSSFSDPYKTVNISMSHGMSSVLILLSKLIHIDLEPYNNSIVKKLLEGGTKYILSQKIDFNIYGSYFPTFSKYSESEISKSRLAWCYGDLGISIALKEAAKSLDDEDLYKLAIDILRYSAQRKNLSTNGVYDACLCHGASGIALIFNSVYKETKDEVLGEAYNFWDKQVLKMIRKINDRSTFPNYNVKTKEWIMHYGILEGISGVGLYLMGEYDILDKLFLLK